MLKKLLRYDFKPVLKYWWIAAVTSFVLSLVGGGFITPLAADNEPPVMVQVASVVVLILVVLGYAAFLLLSQILVFARFYKNFFTDEGYLTFTLPVKRTDLLNAKLILSATTTFVTAVVTVINVLVLLCVGFRDEVFTQKFFASVVKFISDMVQELGVYLIVYILEAFVLFVLSIIFSNLFIFCCITIASIITKKAKVLTAIGIYYVSNGIFTSVVQILYMFGITALSTWLYNLPDYSITPTILLILLCGILFMAIFCAILYTLQYWMIDRKLNLS